MEQEDCISCAETSGELYTLTCHHPGAHAANEAPSGPWCIIHPLASFCRPFKRLLSPADLRWWTGLNARCQVSYIFGSSLCRYVIVTYLQRWLPSLCWLFRSSGPCSVSDYLYESVLNKYNVLQLRYLIIEVPVFCYCVLFVTSSLWCYHHAPGQHVGVYLSIKS